MIIKKLSACSQFTAGDKSILREILNPIKTTLPIPYSLAHASVKPGNKTLAHRLKTSEVYYIIEGSGIMHIDNESETVSAGDSIVIPP
ncbi:MAG: cupin domain-containing protein, partial [bacterium]